MRLYKNNSGQWYGTQAEARRNAPRQWKEVEVPTVKANLLEFLNMNAVGNEQHPVTLDGAESPRVAGQTYVAPYDPDAPAGLVEPPQAPELLSKEAHSWVAWALDNITRGDTKTAKEMLIKGLKIQREIGGQS